MVFATRGLLAALLELARDRDPDPVTVPLSITPAGELDVDGRSPDGLSPESPVFTHFYLPDAGRSVQAVFGVDLGTPHGRTPGVFVSHPSGSKEPDKTDDLREVVFVAVPPWDAESTTAYGRDGRRRELTLLDAEPPTESLP